MTIYITEFNGWLDLVASDATLAYCIVCPKYFKLCNVGKQAIIYNAKNPNHIKNIKGKYFHPPISLPTKKNVPNTSEDVYQASLVASLLYVPQIQIHCQDNSQASIKTFSVKEDNKFTKVIWDLRVVTGQILNFYDVTSAPSLKIMIPYREIAQRFSTTGKTKTSYGKNHRLTPYFQKMLKT